MKKKQEYRQIHCHTVTNDVLDLIDGRHTEEALKSINNIINSYKKTYKQFEFFEFKFIVDKSFNFTYVGIIANRYQTDEEIQKEKEYIKMHEKQVKEDKLREYHRLKKELGL